MKRKFLSIALGVMLCFSSMFVFGACKEKPVDVGEVEAAHALEEAVEVIESSDAIKLEISGLNSVAIITDKVFYVGAGDLQSWIEKEGDVWYKYTKSTITINGKSTTSYKKMESVDVTDDPRKSALDNFDYSDALFSSASKLNGELTINFSSTFEGASCNLTFKINNGKLTNVSISVGLFIISADISYGAHLINEIPNRPTDEEVDWEPVELRPYIDVEGLKTNYFVGESLDLSNVVIKFYKDFSAMKCEEIIILPEMITGFSTSTSGEFTMTVTYNSLELDITYTVSEAA